MILCVLNMCELLLGILNSSLLGKRNRQLAPDAAISCNTRGTSATQRSWECMRASTHLAQPEWESSNYLIAIAKVWKLGEIIFAIHENSTRSPAFNFEGKKKWRLTFDWCNTELIAHSIYQLTRRVPIKVETHLGISDLAPAINCFKGAEENKNVPMLRQ